MYYNFFKGCNRWGFSGCLCQCRCCLCTQTYPCTHMGLSGLRCSRVQRGGGDGVPLSQVGIKRWVSLSQVGIFWARQEFRVMSFGYVFAP